MTPQFSRLNFLRQSGVTWLIFPAATHTRFLHSLGTYWLGHKAANLVKVVNLAHLEDRIRYPVGEFSLGNWLQDFNREFYISLLLHDIGHFPLGHCLENNKDFLNALTYNSQNYLRSHEEISYSLLKGEGDISKAWERYITKQNKYYGIKKFRSIADILKELNERGDKPLSFPAIGYAITGNESYFNDYKNKESDNEKLVKLRVMKEFVSGILDLDRLDHLARDSYFSGTRSVEIKVDQLLNGITIIPSSQNDHSEWTLSKYALSHTISLLFDRKQLYSFLFDEEKVISLNTMINWALYYHLKKIEDENERHKEAVLISMMGDDEFVNRLLSSKSKEAKVLTNLFKNKEYYPLITKISKDNIPLNKRRHEENIEEILEEELGNKFNKEEKPSIIWYVEPNVYSEHPEEFLNVQRFSFRDDAGKIYEINRENEEFREFENYRNYHRKGFVYIFGERNKKIIESCNRVRESLE